MTFLKRLTIVFILTSTFSCTKEGGNLYIEGRVYNPVTGEGIEGIDVFMFKDKVFSGYPSDSKEVGRSTTDADGYYKISHTGGGLVYYVNINSISRTGEEYYKLGWANDNIGLEGKYRFQIPKGKNVTADYEMVPYGGLKLDIDNVNCQGPDDIMNFRSKDYQTEEFRGWSTPREGCYNYQSPEYFKTPIGWKVYEWRVIRNGVTTYYTDSVFLPEGGEAIITMQY